MKRLLALLAGAFGLRALLRRRSPALSHGGSSSPADELRTRLAETRTVPPAEPEPVAEAAEPEPPTVDERRADVHNRARGAIDELRS